METFNSKVYKTIKNMIIKQEIKYGEIISEDHLAKKLKVSRTPIREALNKLSQQGIIDNIPNRSKKIINFNEEYVHDLGITRLNCEILSIRLAIHHGSNADFENLYPLAQKCIEYAESGDGSNWIKSEHNFHLSLIRLSKNDILIKILENLHLKVNLLMYSYIINFLNNKQNVKMAVTGSPSILLICTKDEDTGGYSLYYSSIGAESEFLPTGLDGITSPVIGAVYAFSKYWVVTTENIYTGSSITGLSEYTDKSTDSSWKALGYFVTGDLIVLAAEDGNIHYHDGTETDEEVAGIFKDKWYDPVAILVSEDPVPLTAVSDLPGKILVGSDGYGIFEVTGLGTSDIVVNRIVSGVTTELYEGVILKIAVYEDGVDYLVFACTSQAGIWRNSYSSSTTGWTSWSW